jgi:hypothetical protein
MILYYFLFFGQLTDKMEKINKQGEVDLMELFLKGINIIRANFWMIVLFFLAGIALGLFSYYTSRKMYENKMVVSSGIMTKSYTKNLIDRLNRHKRESNIKAISSLLGVSDSTVKELGFISLENISQSDGDKESDRFIITVDVFNQDILPELQEGLVRYLENNEFAKIRVEQNKSYLKQMISKVEEEIRELEELKKNISNGTFFQTVKGNIMFDPTTVNSKILELTKERITLQNSLALVNSVQVIEGFTKFDRPTKPKLSVSLIAGAMIGLFISGMFIAFKSIRRLLRMADATKQPS